MQHPHRPILALLPMALTGCLSLGDGPSATDVPLAAGAGVREDARMTQVELDQLCMAFGERYLIAIGNGCNQVERAAAEPKQGARAHSFKLQAASSVYDILTGPNPFAKLMDLILLAELHHLVWGTEGVAARVFGEKAAPPLVEALARGREDVWGVADQVLKPEQRKALEEMIREWRAKNPSAESIAFVRFSDFAAFRGKSVLDGVPLGSGLLAPVSEAMRQLEETRLLAERLMFLAKRMPLLVRWHAESFLNTVVGNPEIRKVTEALTRASAVAEALPGKVAEERAILLKTMEEREQGIGAIAKDVRVTTADVKEIARESHALLKETQDVIRAADGLASKLVSPETGQEGHPFDVREFTVAIREGTQAIRELRTTIESPAWTRRIAEVNTAAQSRVQDAGDEARRVIDGITWRAAGLLGLFFLLALAYRFLCHRLARGRTA